MGITYEGATEQVTQIVHRHAVLRRGVERRAGTLCEAAENGVPFERQMAILRGYLKEKVLPHAEAEERTLYQAAAAQAGGSELVRELTGEHHTLAYLAGGSARRGRRRGRQGVGVDRDTVRRARGEG